MTAAAAMTAQFAPRRSVGFLLAYALANAGGVIGYLPLLTLLLPMKIEAVAGAGRLDLFTATVVAGAIAASLSNIAVGAISDRPPAAGGGRRRWVAIGAALTALSYAGVALAATPLTIVIAVVGFQAAVNAMIAPIAAIMADEVPDAQKGVTGGLLALGAPIASGVSALAIALTMLGEGGRFALVPLAAILCVLPLLATRAVPAGEGSSAAPALLRRDLAIAWGSRLLVQIAGSVLFPYLLYYFESVAADVRAGDLPARLSGLLTIAYLVPLPVAVLLGRLSDRSGRRKPFLLLTAAMASAGLVGLAFARDWSTGAAAFALYAVGSSVFLALHSAFAMQLLPAPAHRGRDLGLLNLTNTLPALLGPALTWVLATPDDFHTVMLVLSVLTLGGGLLVLLVRGRR